MTGADADVDVSVIVVTFNSAQIIERCLAAVAAGAPGHTAELIVVDNASSDDTVERVRLAAPLARVIALERNVGFAAANNVALEQARGRFFALVNSDAFPDPGALDVLVQRLTSDPAIGIVGGVLRFPSGARQPSAGRFPSLRSNLGVALLAHRLPLVSRLPLNVFWSAHHYRRAAAVDWVSGAFCAARPEVGPLPSDGFMYGEDVEWASQAKARGLQTWLEPRASAEHLGGGGAEDAGAAALRQRRRVEFELRWFGARGRWAQAAARAIMVLHAGVRIALSSIAVPIRSVAARRAIAEQRALLTAALRLPSARHE